MYKLKLITPISILLLSLYSINSAEAALLSDLLSGSSVTAADKLFDQWAVTFQSSSDGSVPSYAGINVNPLNDGGLHPGPGINIDFGNQMSVTGDGIFAFTDLTLDFHVSSLGPYLIEDNSLNFGLPSLSSLTWNSDQSNDLGMAVEEWVTDISGNELAHKYIEFSVLDDIQNSLLSDWAQFAPQKEIFVKKNFLVWSRDTTDTATLGGIEQRFSQQVPEPGILLLLSMGLIGAGIAKKRQR